MGEAKPITVEDDIVRRTAAAVIAAAILGGGAGVWALNRGDDPSGTNADQDAAIPVTQSSTAPSTSTAPPATPASDTPAPAATAAATRSGATSSAGARHDDASGAASAQELRAAEQQARAVAGVPGKAPKSAAAAKKTWSEISPAQRGALVERYRSMSPAQQKAVRAQACAQYGVGC